MYRAYAVMPNEKPALIEQYLSLEEGVQDILEHWHEDDSALRLIYFVNLETGAVNVTMSCGETTSVVHVTWIGRTVFGPPLHQVYKVVYLTKPDGSYLSTQINEIL